MWCGPTDIAGYRPPRMAFGGRQAIRYRSEVGEEPPSTSDLLPSQLQRIGLRPVVGHSAPAEAILV